VLKKYNLFAGFVAFIIAYGVGLICHQLCEPWYLVGDALEYLKIYNGELSLSPFGYRVLTPYLARLLSWDPYTNFGVVTLTSLSLVSSILAVYFIRMKYSAAFLVVFGILWFTSFPFIYYSSTIVRADGPVFLAVALLIFILSMKGRVAAIVSLIIVGVTAHELILVYPVFLIVDKFFRSDILHTKGYELKSLLLISVIGLGAFLFIHAIIKTAGGSVEPSYLKSPSEIVYFVVRYSGGVINHILRIYASYGPALIFCFFYVLLYAKKNVKMTFFVSFGIVGFATLLATDTLRVMAIYFFVVFLFAAKFVIEIWENGHSGIQAIILLLLQFVYTCLVYGHLRTFELSEYLYIEAAFLSITAIGYCTFISRKKILEVFRKEVAAKFQD
jgi:hypothetical protein